MTMLKTNVDPLWRGSVFDTNDTQLIEYIGRIRCRLGPDDDVQWHHSIHLRKGIKIAPLKAKLDKWIELLY
jgi:hypothetical protein